MIEDRGQAKPELRSSKNKQKLFIMVIDEVVGDIFATKDHHIVFATNTEGYNDSGFAGAVARSYFPEISNTGGNKLGEVLTKNVDGKTFYGIVCHSLIDGWDNADEIILKALNEMDFQDNASIVAIGKGFVGMVSGAPVRKIYSAFKQCNKKLTIYSL